MQPQLSASVIIPVYNDADRLKLCLDCLAAQTLPRERFEVIVVDNGSDDPPRELVESYPFARFAVESKPGSYAARNRGIELAEADILAFTDADCLPRPGWLAAGVELLARSAGRCRAGGKIVITPADEQHPTAAELYDMLFGLNQHGNVHNEQAAVTANAFAHRVVFDKAGGFDGELKSNGDIEWGQRAADKGFPILWAEDAVVEHPARQRIAELIIQTRRHSGGRIDRRRSQPSTSHRGVARFARDLLVAFRLLCPPLARFGQIARRLRADGYGWAQSVKVCGVAWLIRLNILFTSVRVILGAASERR